MASDRDVEGLDKPQKAKKPRLEPELSLASGPRSGMDAALSQILTKIKSPATPNDS